ncbi:MAG: DUF2750 domain-containing protein [Colwellia sp.]|nr:DUF2750 domain-containing protein [Colwellia sp.]MCW9080882.1 DUF2750 domain-containing protein [Colwellia sp.]
MTLTPALITAIERYDEQKRFNYFLETVIDTQEIWVLVDEHGCMMLNTEDEDCVPVWPNQDFAQQWITDDWQACKTEAISLNTWQSRWTAGLEEDELAIVVFPNQAEEGVVLFPDELDFELSKQAKKATKHK